MIAFVESYWRLMGHSHSNASVANILAAAAPGCRMVIHAAEPQIGNMRFSLNPAVDWDLRVETIPEYGISMERRFFFECRLLNRIMRQISAEPDPILIQLSTSGPALRAAALLIRRYPRVRIWSRLHGNLNEITGWRPRHPIRRFLSLWSALAAVRPGNLRLIVLEESIRQELINLLPGLRGQIDVVNEIASQQEVDRFAASPVRQPPTFTFLGNATLSKGADVFIETARKAKEEGLRARFEMYGVLHPTLRHVDVTHLDHSPSHEGLEREAFLAGLARSDFVVVPYKPEYYTLSASGVLADALTALKPIIALPVPFARQVFHEFGDIGYLCHDDRDLTDTILSLARHPDPQRYSRQVEGMRNLRNSRTLDVVASHVRGMMWPRVE